MPSKKSKSKRGGVPQREAGDSSLGGERASAADSEASVLKQTAGEEVQRESASQSAFEDVPKPTRGGAEGEASASEPKPSSNPSAASRDALKEAPQHSEPRLSHAHSVDLDVFAEEKQVPETPPSPRSPPSETTTQEHQLPSSQAPPAAASVQKAQDAFLQKETHSIEKESAEAKVAKEESAEAKVAKEESAEAKVAKEESAEAKVAKEESAEAKVAKEESAEAKVAEEESAEAKVAEGESREAEVTADKGADSFIPPSIFVTQVGVDPKKAVAKALRVLGLGGNATSSSSSSESSDSSSSSEEEVSDPVLSSLSPVQRAHLLRLQENAGEAARLEEDFELQVQRLRFELHQKLQPVYDARASLLAASLSSPGVAEAAAAAEAALSGLSAETAASEAKSGEGFLETVGTPAIPGFWVRVLERVKATKGLLAETDRAALMFLADVRLEARPLKKDGFAVDFVFRPNPFFSNERLRKEFLMAEENGEVILKSTRGTPISWAEGMDLTKTITIRKQRNVRTGQVRVVQQIVPTASFFNFFESSEVPSERAMKVMSDWEVREVTQRLQNEFEAAKALRDVIIPKAVEVFMGVCEAAEDSSSSEEEN